MDHIHIDSFIHSEKLKAYHLRSGIRRDIQPHYFYIVLEVLAKAIMYEKVIKCINMEMEEVKLPSFADCAIIYRKF